MILNNKLILLGSYDELKYVKDELNKLPKNPKQSKLHTQKTSRYVKKVQTEEIIQYDNQYLLNIKFTYKKNNIKSFIDLFNQFHITSIHMCENAKENIWIVNNYSYVEKYRLMPKFVIAEVLLEYMDYKESAIILDNYQTVKFDRNLQQVVINDKLPTYEELLDVLFENSIKGKNVYLLLTDFINNFNEKCINTYEDLYHISNDIENNEEPSPFALFIVIFGIIGIIIIILLFTGNL